MRGDEYVQALITEAKTGVKIDKDKYKGLSDDELRTFINATVNASNAIKACAFAGFKKLI